MERDRNGGQNEGDDGAIGGVKGVSEPSLNQESHVHATKGQAL
jgi:hypothetical protein